MNALQANNPFALMLEPQQVLQAIEGSTSLRGLRQQQYLLLDRPAGLAPQSDLAAFDALQDEQDEPFFDEPLQSETVSGSHTYQAFPRVFN
jgi:hypothetical protein